MVAHDGGDEGPRKRLWGRRWEEAWWGAQPKDPGAGPRDLMKRSKPKPCRPETYTVWGGGPGDKGKNGLQDQQRREKPEKKERKMKRSPHIQLTSEKKKREAVSGRNFGGETTLTKC